jgi:hypothetical protein
VNDGAECDEAGTNPGLYLASSDSRSWTRFSSLAFCFRNTSTSDSSSFIACRFRNLDRVAASRFRIRRDWRFASLESDGPPEEAAGDAEDLAEGDPPA